MRFYHRVANSTTTNVSTDNICTISLNLQFSFIKKKTQVEGVFGCSGYAVQNVEGFPTFQENITLSTLRLMNLEGGELEMFSGLMMLLPNSPKTNFSAVSAMFAKTVEEHQSSLWRNPERQTHTPVVPT
jgi:hypothetical protein